MFVPLVLTSDRIHRKSEQQTSTPIANNVSKNDWKTDTKTTNQQNIGGVPTFIRVIVIRRIIINDMKHNIGNNDNNNKYIEHLMTCMKDLDVSTQSKVEKTLCQLITKDGIKNYFNSWNEKDNNPNIIDIIFNKLILTKFVNQYRQIITYKSKNMKNHYQDLVFNIKDLMCTIFEL